MKTLVSLNKLKDRGMVFQLTRIILEEIRLHKIIHYVVASLPPVVCNVLVTSATLFTAYIPSIDTVALTLLVCRAAAVVCS